MCVFSPSSSRIDLDPGLVFLSATFKRSNPNYRYAVPVPRVLDADVDGGENDARWGSTPQNRAPATVPPLPQGNMNLPANPPTNPVVTAPYVYPVTTSHSVSRYRRLNSHALPSTGVIMESDKGPYEKVNMEDYSEEDYLLASTLVYGFSLVDKMWRTFLCFPRHPQTIQTLDFLLTYG